MSKDNVVQLEGRDEMTDVMTRLLQPGARELLAQAIDAEVRDFLAQLQGRCLEKGRDAMVPNGHQPEHDIQTGIGHEPLTFYDFSAKHWQSIRTTNPIESTFATIRQRTTRSKGCLSRATMLHIVLNLRLCAEKRWRKLRGFDYFSKVITGIKFNDVVELQRDHSESRLIQLRRHYS